jgi:hypothetical protein
MPSEDPYGFSGGPDGPYINGFAVTPSDSVDFAKMCSALWVGTGGAVDVAAVMQSGTVLVFKNVASGTLLRVRASRVNSTGTGATNIVALF